MIVQNHHCVVFLEEGLQKVTEVSELSAVGALGELVVHFAITRQRTNHCNSLVSDGLKVEVDWI
jgi:hypothetical protein